MSASYTDQQLQAFLDEALTPELMAQIETQLRQDARLMDRMLGVVGRREAGVHGLGEIWRRHRLSCPTRLQLGNYLLGALDENWTDYIQFHLKHVGCRLCSANLEDLRKEQRQLEAANEAIRSAQSQRRRRYFQSSAGYLNRDQ